MDSALEVYHKDKFARSSTAARASVEASWREYHGKVLRLTPHLVGTPVIPVLPEVLSRIAALMKLDGFRSFANYVAWAKSLHVASGHEWTQVLELEAKQGCRSVNRGMGTARQSASFDVLALCRLDRQKASKVCGQPVFPIHATILGALWIVREIELAWTAVGDITIDTEAKVISWFLPVSKVDHRAKACTRSWGCICGDRVVTTCPFHMMTEYRKLIQDYMEEANINMDDNFPFFPDFKGNVIKKTGMVGALESVVGRTGEALTDGAGRKRFGGHSMRVTGSRFWVGAGLEVFKVQIFARWGSSVVLRYVADVPIANLTGDVCSRPLVESPGYKPLMDMLCKHIKHAEEQATQLKAELKRLQASMNPSFVQNASTKVWHAVLVGGMNHPPALWRSGCGWHYGALDHSLSPNAPPVSSRRCDRPGCSLARLLIAESGPSSSGSVCGSISSADESG